MKCGMQGEICTKISYISIWLVMTVQRAERGDRWTGVQRGENFSCIAIATPMDAF